MVWKKTKNILMNQHSLINFCLEKGLFFTFVASYHVGFASLNPGTLAHFLGLLGGMHGVNHRGFLRGINVTITLNSLGKGFL